MKNKQSQHTSICPKCGYDQSGMIATWKAQCPLHGLCPECGYGFNWGDVLDPSRVELGWYVEHAHTNWEMVKRTMPTLWYLLFPNRYWRRLGMEAPRSLKRFVLWVSAMMLLLHLVTAVGLVIGNHMYLLRYNQATRVWLGTQNQAIQTRGLQSIYDTSGMEYWYPLIGESLLYPAVSRWFFFDPISVLFGMYGLWLAGISFMWLVLFCTFSTTRKRSKLRMIHVVRAMVIGGSLSVLIYELGRVLDVFMFVNETWGPYGWIDQLIGAVMSIAPLALLIWVQWFWISAVRVGWKVKANWFELFLVMVASFFGTIIGAGFVYLASVVGMAIEIFAPLIGI